MGKTEFIAGMHAARKAIDDAIAGMDERKASAPIDPNWSTKDTLVHISAYDIAVTQAVAQARRGEAPTWAWQAYPDFDAWNAVQIGKRQGRGLQAVLRELRDTRSTLLAALESWPDEAGPFGPETWDLEESPVRFLTNHEIEHAELITGGHKVPA